MMKLKDIDKKVLNYLYGEYLKRHGSTFAHLGDFRISMLDNEMKRAVPELSGESPESEKELFEELSSRGLVALCGNSGDISLTDKGFSEASKTALDKFMEFLDSNPRMVMSIPLVSFMLAVIGLSLITQ